MTMFESMGDLARVLQGAARNDREHREGSEGELKQAAGAAFEAGSMLLELFTTLPAALVAAEKAEHARLVERYGDEHPWTQGVGESAGALGGLEARLSRGRARAVRALAVAWQPPPGPAFHGFVTDESGAPLRGLRVRLAGLEGRAPEARTAEDGYFTLPLPERKPSEGAAEAEGETEKGARRKRAAEPAAATVVIADAKGAPLYEDPVPLEVESGSAYREYRLRERPKYEERGPASSKEAPKRGPRKR